MKHKLFGGLALVLGVLVVPTLGREPGKSSTSTSTGDVEVPELRARAALLHDVLHATLQVVHHRYYREDEGLLIPAVALKQVFADVEERHRVKLRWLAVDAQAMNRDHEPQNEFEEQAVKLLARGKTELEAAENGVYRRAAPIRLSNECLKCHLPNRTSTADRTAALVIEFPLRVPD